jgi:hypothetical protein
MKIRNLAFPGKTISAFVLLLFCAGCMGMDAVHQAKVSYDPYNHTTEIHSHIVKIRDPNSGLIFFDVDSFIRAFVAGNDPGYIELHVVSTLQDSYALFSSAIDSDGKKLPFNKVDREKIAKDLRVEEFGATLTRSYLVAHRNSGLNIRFYGRRGDLTVVYPAEHVQEFLAIFDKEQAEKAKK